jgi:hypothetical protein
MACFVKRGTAAMMAAYNFGATEVLANTSGGNGSLIGPVLQRYRG